MRLKLLGGLPLMMALAWLVLAVILFSWSIGGDRYLYREVIEGSRERGSRPAVVVPPPMTEISRLPQALPQPKATSPGRNQLSAPPLPPDGTPEPFAPLDPPPAVWELQSMEVVKNEADYFEARFQYYGGRLSSHLSYQSRQPVWIIDLPADWANHLKNNYHWPEGLVRRLALGLHNGYLRLVLYLRQPHGGRDVLPVITPIDQKTFTITLRGAPPDGGEAGHGR
ncbi:MAG: hypothetical protein LBP33_04970 [Candidatus Adiutrix sp.]|jgi:hypothetical protein|nr:hypothetical protein [Candidatus Adiutrix sp.]